MSNRSKWAFLCIGLLVVSMGMAMLRNAYGVDGSTLLSLISGVFVGGLTVVIGRLMGLFGKKAE